MASIEQRGSSFRLIFKYQGKRYTHSLGKSDSHTANMLCGALEKTLVQLQQRFIPMPEGIDVKEFILAGGVQKSPAIVSPAADAASSASSAPLTMSTLEKQYMDTMHAILEPNTLRSMKIHSKHFKRKLGEDFQLKKLTLALLQNYVIERTKEFVPGTTRQIKPVTIKKEVASLLSMWNWARQMSMLDMSFPNNGLRLPKTTEKPPFQTWAEIKQQIKQGGLSAYEEKQLWNNLFLSAEEVEECLAYVRRETREPWDAWAYPMFCFVAYTGARRSEALRALVTDVNFEAKTILIHEKKRARGKDTTRRCPMTPRLAKVLKEWIAIHPGGQRLFIRSCRRPNNQFRAKIDMNLGVRAVEKFFPRVFKNSKWLVLKGWHVFRHSFCSCCAAKGIDQRKINAWVGHQTEEMAKRYRHMFPDQQHEELASVYG
jgi:integrase